MPASPPADDPEQVACAVALLLDAAHEIASGRQTLADAQAEFIADAEELFAAVRGPGDFRWPLQRRVAEGVIRWGGFTSEELRFALMGQLDAEALDRGDGWSNIGTAAPPPDSGLAPPVPDAVGARDTPSLPTPTTGALWADQPPPPWLPAADREPDPDPGPDPDLVDPDPDSLDLDPDPDPAPDPDPLPPGWRRVKMTFAEAMAARGYHGIRRRLLEPSESDRLRAEAHRRTGHSDILWP